MHRFDVNAWHYGTSSIEELAALIHRNLPKTTNIITDEGGKAFGLSLCDALFADIIPTPPWMTVSYMGSHTHEQIIALGDNDDWSVGNFGQVIARSNAMDEDWISPDSGTHASKSFNPTYGFSQVEEVIAAAGSCVVQRHKSMVGLVIDLAYSPLLKHNVLRIAVGRATPQASRPWTHPTWDTTCHAGLYHAETGEAIDSLAAEHVDINHLVRLLVQKAVPRLQKAGISFGLQFELVGRHDEFHLLQMRPSPGTLQGQQTDFAMRGTLVKTTGHVSNAGTAGGILHEYRRGPLTPPDEPFILLGNQRQNRAKRAGGLHHILAEGREYGMMGTLTRYPFYGSFSHGAILSSTADDDYMHALQGGPILCIGDQAMNRLTRRARAETVAVLVVSDGIVGQVYLID